MLGKLGYAVLTSLTTISRVEQNSSFISFIEETRGTMLGKTNKYPN